MKKVKSIKEEMAKHVLHLIRLRFITEREVFMGTEEDFTQLETQSGDSW
jgi:hypothetical protein